MRPSTSAHPPDSDSDGSYDPNVIDGIEATQLMTQGSMDIGDVKQGQDEVVMGTQCDTQIGSLGIEATQLMTQESVDIHDVKQEEEDDVAMETGSIDGIESTQLMSQGSVRKRDKKKKKNAVDAARKVTKKQMESQDERDLRQVDDAMRKAKSRSMESKRQKALQNKRDASTRMSGDIQQLAKVAILTPRNKEALQMNNDILDRRPGPVKVYRSFDEIIHKEGSEANDSMNFTTEFLNRMTPSGMPPHELRIKKGSIIMLLRNLDVKNSMCNGTRFIVDDMGQYVLQCKFVNGPRQGETVMIPRIKLHYDQNLPFTMSRLLFPIRLSFAMTINKSQGQTFDKIGLKLEEPIFSHGQFYVALSRSTTKEGIRIESTFGTVNNIVYKEVLL